MVTAIDGYLAWPEDIVTLLTHRLQPAMAKHPRHKIELFLRADDVGVPGYRFSELLQLCMDFEAPLALAVVPAWITAARWEAIQSLAHKKAPLWCWHQHGWRHANHEPLGKKQEFGPSRSRMAIQHDLDQGRLRLQRILGNDYFPIFTPPWNRCDLRSLIHLKQHKYVAVSRFARSKPQPLPGLPDLAVNVDLNTRKESDPATFWNNLLDEFSLAFESGRCGIMLHHQRMSPPAFRFLELLLKFVIDQPHIRLMHLSALSRSK